MTSIQDAWGVRTLDDRSETTIPSSKTRRQTQIPPQQTTAIVPITNDVPMMLDNNKRRLYSTGGYHRSTTDESQLLGFLTLLMIFILMDKLISIWNKS